MTTITSDSPAYERTRIASMWGKRTPDRRASAFVAATTVDDDVSAVRSARTRDLPLTVRAGGHNWSGSHLRDAAVVVEVSAMSEVHVDALLMARHLPRAAVPGIVLTAPVFADSEEQARSDLAFVNDCPVLDIATLSNPGRS